MKESCLHRICLEIIELRTSPTAYYRCEYIHIPNAHPIVYTYNTQQKMWVKDTLFCWVGAFAVHVDRIFCFHSYVFCIRATCIILWIVHLFGISLTICWSGLSWVCTCNNIIRVLALFTTYYYIRTCITTQLAAEIMLYWHWHWMKRKMFFL